MSEDGFYFVNFFAFEEFWWGSRIVVSVYFIFNIRSQ